jgi:hypothetical protein
MAWATCCAATLRASRRASSEDCRACSNFWSAARRASSAADHAAFVSVTRSESSWTAASAAANAARQRTRSPAGSALPNVTTPSPSTRAPGATAAVPVASTCSRAWLNPSNRAGSLGIAPRHHNTSADVSPSARAAESNSVTLSTEGSSARRPKRTAALAAASGSYRSTCGRADDKGAGRSWGTAAARSAATLASASPKPLRAVAATSRASSRRCRAREASA